MEFTEIEKMAIWRCVAAILHIGELEFDKASFTSEMNAPGKIKNEQKVKDIAALLGYENYKDFEKILLQSVNVIRNQEMWTF